VPAPAAGAVSPTRKPAHAVAGARARHVGATRVEHTTARADPDVAAGAVRPATPTTVRSADPATTRAARLTPASEARAAAPSERPLTRALPLDPGPSGYDPTLLLMIVFTAGAAFAIGRESRRRPRAGARR
jgi:hypothetical protein